MTKQIGWTGFGVRELYGYTWVSGQVHAVEDEEIALDILTQPDENFWEELAAETTKTEVLPEVKEGIPRKRKNSELNQES